jgi:peroxiredoxin
MMRTRYRWGLILIIAIYLSLGYAFRQSLHSDKGLPLQSSQSKHAGVYETLLAIDGQKAPNFELKTLNGETKTFSDFKGKTLLLVTWATWCKECHAELQSLQKESETRAPSFNIVLVNMSSEEGALSDVKQYVITHHLTLPVLLDQKGNFKKMYHVQVIPTSILVDSFGNVLHTFYGPVKVSTIENWLPST